MCYHCCYVYKARSNPCMGECKYGLIEKNVSTEVMMDKSFITHKCNVPQWKLQQTTDVPIAVSL